MVKLFWYKRLSYTSFSPRLLFGLTSQRSFYLVLVLLIVLSGKNLASMNFDNVCLLVLFPHKIDSFNFSTFCPSSNTPLLFKGAMADNTSSSPLLLIVTLFQCLTFHLLKESFVCLHHKSDFRYSVTRWFYIAAILEAICGPVCVSGNFHRERGESRRTIFYPLVYLLKLITLRVRFFFLLK